MSNLLQFIIAKLLFHNMQNSQHRNRVRVMLQASDNIFIFSQNIMMFPQKPLEVKLNHFSADTFQPLTNIFTPHHIFWSLKCENPPDKTEWQDKVYNSVRLDSLWRLRLLLLGHVIVPAWVKATGFSHLLPFRGGDAERRVHLIIGLSASVFMLDFRFCPAHTLETAGVCVSVCVRRDGWQIGQDHTTGNYLQPIYSSQAKTKLKQKKNQIPE